MPINSQEETVIQLIKHKQAYADGKLKDAPTLAIAVRWLQIVFYCDLVVLVVCLGCWRIR